MSETVSYLDRLDKLLDKATRMGCCTEYGCDLSRWSCRHHDV